MWPATDVDGGHESAVPFGRVGEVAVLTSMLDAAVAGHGSALLLRGRPRDFCSRVLAGTVVLGENPCIVRLSNSWIIMNPGGSPTPDKPGISVVEYLPGDTTSIFLNLRVADIQACYQDWKAKGAEFVTPPIDRGAEIRCYMRDPDGYLIEVGQSTGLLRGKKHAMPAPQGRAQG